MTDVAVCHPGYGHAIVWDFDMSWMTAFRVVSRRVFLRDCDVNLVERRFLKLYPGEWLVVGLAADMAGERRAWQLRGICSDKGKAAALAATLAVEAALS
jgi:hypothetical protein